VSAYQFINRHSGELVSNRTFECRNDREAQGVLKAFCRITKRIVTDHEVRRVPRGPTVSEVFLNDKKKGFAG
jgi:hypothetical protein